MNLKQRSIVIGSTVGVATVLVVAALVFTGVIPLRSTLSCPRVSGTSRTFTIIADLNGFNNSKSLASQNGFGPWPVMSVSLGDQVTICLVNTDKQTHGLAVGVLHMQQLLIPEGQALSISFLASETGQFRVYCTVTSCSVHDYMQNGQLNVS